MLTETKYPRRTASPLDSFLSIQEEMDRLVNSYFSGAGEVETAKTVWAPPVDIYEDDNNFYLKAELPGMDQKDIQISLENNMISIKGERKDEKDMKGHYYKMERLSGSFARKFNLPAHVDSEKISAAYKNGVLEIKLPKSEEKKPKLIAVKTD